MDTCPAGNRAKKGQQGRKQGAVLPVRYNQPVGFVASGIVDPYQLEHAIIQPALAHLAAEAPELAAQPLLHESAMEPQLLHGMSPLDDVHRRPMSDAMAGVSATLRAGGKKTGPDTLNQETLSQTECDACAFFKAFAACASRTNLCDVDFPGPDGLAQAQLDIDEELLDADLPAHTGLGFGKGKRCLSELGEPSVYMHRMKAVAAFHHMSLSMHTWSHGCGSLLDESLSMHTWSHGCGSLLDESLSMHTWSG